VSSEAQRGAPLRRYTLAEARYILSGVYCVLCLPEDGEDGFASVRWFPGCGTPECAKCGDGCVPDLRIWIASEKAAARWLARENAAIDAYNATIRPSDSG
jgi:hypothetical protein